MVATPDPNAPPPDPNAPPGSPPLPSPAPPVEAPPAENLGEELQQDATAAGITAADFPGVNPPDKLAADLKALEARLSVLEADLRPRLGRIEQAIAGRLKSL